MVSEDYKLLPLPTPDNGNQLGYVYGDISDSDWSCQQIVSQSCHSCPVKCLKMAEANYCIPLENLLEPLTPIADHWHNLAAALDDVPQDVITSINARYAGNTTDCLQNLLEWWSKKQTDEQNAWKVLIDALQKHGHENISKNLAEKYLNSTDQEEQTSSSEPPESLRQPSTGERHQEMTEMAVGELEAATNLQLAAAATNRFRGILANDICRKLGPRQTSSLKFMCRSIICHATLTRIDGSLGVLVELMNVGKLSPTALGLLTEIFRILGWEVHLKTLKDAGFNIPENVECDDINKREFIFAKYLMKIAQGLTDEEVQQLGFTIINQWKGMGAQAQQYSAIQLFIVLQQRRIITPIHVARLHHELHELKREDLCQFLEEYIIESKQEYIPQLQQLSEGHYFGPVLEPPTEVYRQLPTAEVVMSERDPDQLFKEMQEHETKTVEAETKTRELMEKIKKQTELVEEKSAELQASEENLSALENELDALRNRRKEFIAKIPKPRIQLPTYKIDNKRNHGFALIINNFVFNGDTEDADDIDQWVPENASSGRNIDEHNLIEIFSVLGYKVEVQQNCKAEEIQAIFQAIKEQDNSGYDSFICCIMSQGRGRSILCSDNKLVAIDQLMNGLNKEFYRQPKIFFIHAYSMDAKPDATPIATDSGLIPEGMDFLCMYTNPPMEVAWQDGRFGSWFCRALCEIFYVHAQQYDLLTMLTMVAEKLSKATYEDQKYYPIIVSQLRKLVRFQLIRPTK